MQTSHKNITNKKKLKQWLKKTIGYYLKAERLKRNLDVTTVAKLLYTTPETIENTEQGKNRPQWHTIARLLQLYKKDLVLTLTDTNEE